MKRYQATLAVASAVAMAFLLFRIISLNASAANIHQPLIQYMAIDPGKYESRKTDHEPILVIHETATSGAWVKQSVNLPHYRASYHAFIPRDGKIVFMVPPDKTAYTAGPSQFNEKLAAAGRGVNPGHRANEYDASGYGSVTVNHFAYQVEMESPPDGYWCREPAPRPGVCVDGGGRGPEHSGYTDKQYRALAWLAVKTGIPPARITTHSQVDTSGKKSDPRSFDWSRFWRLYKNVADRSQTIFLGIEDRHG